MYQLGLLSPLPKDDIGKLIAFMAGAAFCASRGIRTDFVV
jgi:hypothetical protein